MASCPDQKVGRQLILHRGLHPLVLDPPSSPSNQPLDAVDMSKCAGFCQAGDTIIVAYRDYDSPAKDLALKIITVWKEQSLFVLFRFVLSPLGLCGGPLDSLWQLVKYSKYLVRMYTRYTVYVYTYFAANLCIVWHIRR